MPLNHTPNRLYFPTRRKELRRARDRASEQPTGCSADNISIRGEHPIRVEIDGDYNNQVPNPYTANRWCDIRCTIGVIAWSLGLDREWANCRCTGDKNHATLPTT